VVHDDLANYSTFEINNLKKRDVTMLHTIWLGEITIRHGQREEGVPAEELQHTTLATACLRFLFVAAKIWKHSGRVGISYSDQYAERGLFQRLMERLREIAKGPASFLPVLARPLTC